MITTTKYQELKWLCLMANGCDKNMQDTVYTLVYI